jgi:hypothetical protein
MPSARRGRSAASLSSHHARQDTTTVLGIVATSA